jgi:hypothetical protein
MANWDVATARWAVALEGEAFDIEDARDLFAQPGEVQVRVIEVAPDRNPIVLLAKDFESLKSNSEVAKGARPPNSRQAARNRRRGDRMKGRPMSEPDASRCTPQSSE